MSNLPALHRRMSDLLTPSSPLFPSPPTLSSIPRSDPIFRPHRLLPLFDPILLPSYLKVLAEDAVIKGIKRGNETIFNAAIIKFLDALLPSVNLTYWDHEFDLTTCDGKGLRNVNVLGGVSYEDSLVLRHHSKWCKEGERIIEQVNECNGHRRG